MNMSRSIKNCAIVAGALLAAAWSLPAMASVTFDFSFTAPLTNGSPGSPGDVASGAGSLFTSDADTNGHYRVLGASGSFVAYQGEQDVRTISAAGGAYNPATDNFDDAFIYKDVSGKFVTDNIFLYDATGPGGIGLQLSPDGSYGGFFTEVGVANGSLTFTQVATSVPEPGTWALMLFGLGAAGVSMRRRRAPEPAYA